VVQAGLVLGLGEAVLCARCHQAIHHGKPAANCT
jgi:hypothetical protein